MARFAHLVGTIALLACTPVLAGDRLQTGVYNPQNYEGNAPRLIWVNSSSANTLQVTLDGTTVTLKKKGGDWVGPIEQSSFLDALSAAKKKTRVLKISALSRDSGDAEILVGDKRESAFFFQREKSLPAGVLKREPSLFRNLGELLQKHGKSADVTPTEVKAVVGPELADGKAGKLSATEAKVLEWARHRMFGHGDSPAAAEIDKYLWGDEHVARKFVLANAGDADSKLFPGADSGEDGLHAYLLDSKASAERMLAFARLWDPSDTKLKNFKYDEDKHLLIAVRSTFDEEDLYFAVFDKTTGKGELLGERMGVVDADSTVDKDELKKIVPKLDLEFIDHMELIDALVKGSTELGLFN